MELNRGVKKSYVSGLLMDWTMDRFLLIDKKGIKKHDGIPLYWQGIGGEIEKKIIPGEDSSVPFLEFEHPRQAMTREFKEETGHLVRNERWHCYIIKDYGVTKIYFFVAFASPAEFNTILSEHARLADPEGNIQLHDLVGVLFDRNNYTFDLPYLLSMIIYEMKAGMLMKLDPEGVNFNGKAP